MEQLNICMFKSYNPSQFCHIIFSIDLFRSTEKFIFIYYTESKMIHIGKEESEKILDQRSSIFTDLENKVF